MAIEEPSLVATLLRRCAVERAAVGDQASNGVKTIAAALETIEHGLCPSGLARGGRRQLGNRAIAKPKIARFTTAARCAVERALLVGDQASEGGETVGDAREWRPAIEHGLCPDGLALGGRRQLENRAAIASSTTARCAVERALFVEDQASEGVKTIVAALEPIEHGLCPNGLA